MIKTDMIPRMQKLLEGGDSDDSNLQFAEDMQQCLQMCWNMVAVLNMEVVNVLLFYISYPIRNVGEPFVREKIMKLHSGRWGDDRVLQLLGRLPAAAVAASPSSSANFNLKIVRLSREGLARNVLRILERGCIASEAAGESTSISPLISIRLIQFAHGALQLIADGSLSPEVEEGLKGGGSSSSSQDPSLLLMHQTFVLDAPGIDGLQKVMR